jgi:pimeloyl-ACP methyl ester carboxylesterase
MDKLEKKTLDVSRGFTYAYYFSPAKDDRQTLLLIHGFPDSPEEYSDVVRDYLLPNGYGVIAIDCLGYSGSSKPLDKEAYNLQLVSQDIKEILDKESVDKVVSTGHDWVSGQHLLHFASSRDCTYKSRTGCSWTSRGVKSLKGSTTSSRNG